jgi:hypothetical protein
VGKKQQPPKVRIKNLRRWGIPTMDPGLFYTSPRPGRAEYGPNAPILEEFTRAWFHELERMLPGRLILVCLLGHKGNDNSSEYEPYRFLRDDEDFGPWLRAWFPDIEFHSHRTVDYRGIPSDLMSQICADVRNCLLADCTPVVMDSGGKTRVECVVRALGAVSRSDTSRSA